MESLLSFIANFMLTLADDLFNGTEFNQKKKGRYFIALMIYLLTMSLFTTSTILTFGIIRLLLIDFSLLILFMTLLLLIAVCVLGYKAYQYSIGIFQLSKFFLTK